MKVILSRKGMDSESGRVASPILPDGTLLSLPIPDRKSKKKYEDIQYKGQNYRDIITRLHPDFDFEKIFPKDVDAARHQNDAVHR